MLKDEENIPITTIREVRLLKRLKHVNIIHFEEVINTKKDVKLVMEFCVKDFKKMIQQSRSRKMQSYELKYWL